MQLQSFDAEFSLTFRHRVLFTQDALDPSNPTLAQLIEPQPHSPARVLVCIDTHLAQHFPDLPQQWRRYAHAHSDRIQPAGKVEPVPGGELCKNDRDAIYRVLDAINEAGIDRQSYVLAIGGGAAIDCVGLAAAVAHRGVRLIRMPTTTLAQADGAVGVKNGINGFGKKNFLGSFAVPAGVVNDPAFLSALPDRDFRSGFSEAVKVALLKDPAFFDQIERDAAGIDARDMSLAMPVIQRSAQLHLEHIAYAGDPFELTTARPLDFGHWAAHKLEPMTGFALTHGEAVAIGLALDVLYSQQLGILDEPTALRICRCLASLGFELAHEQLADADLLLHGLEEFREHLGGQLTITLLQGIGQPIDVHEIDTDAMRRAVTALQTLALDQPAN